MKIFPLKQVGVASRVIYTNSYSLHKFKSPNHEILHTFIERCQSMSQLKQIHAQIIVNSLANETLSLSKLISFSALSDTGSIGYAHKLFDEIRQPNVFMYNTLIRGYSHTDNALNAILLYQRMIVNGLSPNEFTFPFVLKACGLESLCWLCLVVHCQVVKLGLGSHVCVQNGLLNSYVCCGLNLYAWKVFDEISVKSLVSWNSMIGGCSKVGDCEGAFLLFNEMRKLDVKPDKFTLVSLLSACSQTGNVDFGRFVHLYVEVSGIEIDLIVRNSLLDMYAKCGLLQSAQRIFERMPDKNVVSWTSMVNAYANYRLVDFARRTFDQMPVKNVVSWNSMIFCYVQEVRCRDALDLFYEMLNLRIEPDEATLLYVLSACSQTGNLVMGKKIHSYICSIYDKPDVTVFNSLIDMYAKCGDLKIAMDVFAEMPKRNLVSWNTIIRGLALHGHGVEAIKLFERMQVEGILPDEITFTGLLSACSHSGLVEMGRYYFDIMSSVYGIKHEMEHHASMIDNLGRGGHLKEAAKLVMQMPMKPDIVIWGALLGACRTHRNIEMGKQILKQILELQPHSSGLYVLLSNLFTEAQRWEDARNLQKLMNNCGIIKCKAASSIEVDGCVYEFMVDDNRKEVTESIHSALSQLTDHLKSIGTFQAQGLTYR